MARVEEDDGEGERNQIARVAAGDGQERARTNSARESNQIARVAARKGKEKRKGRRKGYAKENAEEETLERWGHGAAEAPPSVAVASMEAPYIHACIQTH